MRPFAFLATYTTRLSAKGAPQHRPLGHAVEESSAARDRQRLLALLLPVERAAEKSALVRALVEGGDIYHPLAWTAGEAYAFLREVPVLESAGVAVRVPDWWSGRTAPRAQVKVTVGGQGPSRLGTEAVLDFSAALAIDGEPLSEGECRALLEATEGLVLIRGRWVEADGKRLGEVLDHWKQVERTARRDGIPFHEAMRLVAGVSLASDGASSLPEASREWSRVEAGPWMKGVLDGLRSPGGVAGADPGSELLTELRPYQRDGVRWLWWAHELGLGVCLADDMGLGKTLQVLSLLVLRRRSRPDAPALLVVPASLVANWKAEAARFAPSLAVQVAHAASARAGELASLRSGVIEGADAVITTYGSLTRIPWLLEREWGLVVLDEAQAIKNPGAETDPRDEGGARPGPGGAHGDAGREPAGGPLVALRLLAARVSSAARSSSGRRPSAWPRASASRSLWPAAPSRGSVHSAPAQDRPACHRRPAGQDRGDGLLRPDQDPGGALPARRRRAPGRPRWLRGHRAARRDPRLAPPPEADLQPPLAVPRRRGLGARGERQAAAPARDLSRSSPSDRRSCSSSPSFAR